MGDNKQTARLVTDSETLSHCDNNGFVRDAYGKIEERLTHLDTVGSEITYGKRVDSVKYEAPDGKTISISFDEYQSRGRPTEITTKNSK